MAARSVISGVALVALLGGVGWVFVGSNAFEAASGQTLALYVDAAGTTTTCAGPGAAACSTLGAATAVAVLQSDTAVTVHVAPGTFAAPQTLPTDPNLVIPAVPASDTLTIAGSGTGLTYLAGNGSLTAALTLSGGTVTIDGVTIEHGLNSGLAVLGGSVTVQNSAVTGSQGTFGGGVDLAGGSLVVSGSTISGNVAGNQGGGIYAASSTHLTVQSSTVNGNESYYGGGVFSAALTFTLTNSTVTGNSGHGGHGIGANLYLQGGASTQRVQNQITISASTISAAVPTTSGIAVYKNDLLGSSVAMTGSIVSASACVNVSNTQPAVASGSYNVESDNSCGLDATNLVGSTTIDVTSTLAANGSSGPQTLAIASTSSARDYVAAASCLAADERGVSRSGATCDAGAYEYGSTGITPAPVAANIALTSTGSAVTTDVVAASQTFGAAATVTITQAPSHGTGTLSGSVITYKPLAGYGGPDVIKYKLTTAGGSSVGTISITVSVPPTASPDRAVTFGAAATYGTAVDIDVLGNDNSLHGGSLSIVGLTTPANGLAFVRDGIVVYVPKPGFFGTDTFTYQAKSTIGTSATTTVTVTVQH